MSTALNKIDKAHVIAARVRASMEIDTSKIVHLLNI